MSALLLGTTVTFSHWRARIIVEALGMAMLTATLFFLVYREDLITVLH